MQPPSERLTGAAVRSPAVFQASNLGPRADAPLEGYHRWATERTAGTGGGSALPQRATGARSAGRSGATHREVLLRQHKNARVLPSLWFFRELSAMPDGNNPHRAPFDTVEESVGRDDHLTVGKFGELRDRPPGIWEPLESLQDSFGTAAEAQSGWGLVPSN